jgi:hypothetical protein
VPGTTPLTCEERHELLAEMTRQAVDDGRLVRRHPHRRGEPVTTTNTPSGLCLKWSPNGIVACHRPAGHPAGGCGDWKTPTTEETNQ